MKTLTILMLTLLMVLWMAPGCKDGHDEHKDDDHAGHKDCDHDEHDGDEHDGDEHDGDEHDGDGHAGHGHAGERHVLGEKKIGDWTVAVGQVGEIEHDSSQAIFEIKVTGATPAAVRAQIVATDKSASLKGKANVVAAGVYDVHVLELPTALHGATLLVEIEGPDGVKATGEFGIEVDEH